ncbi:MAG: sugar ABC transporter ATP-binding protein, partial [Pseudonocardia sp.]|nr:sugar ABC transporter ATP-binding protein [Pseudonocardia sp.]
NASFVWDEFPARRADGRSRREAVMSIVKALNVRTPGLDQRIGALSGGNQQKIVFGNWLTMNTKVVLLDEPTRGVDVGARSEIYALIRRLAASGVAVVLVSSEVPEVLGLAHRVLVVREGRVVHEAPSSELDEGRVLDLVMEGSAHV